MILKAPKWDEQGERTDREQWLLPGEPRWPFYFEQNLRRKAETLGLDPDVRLEQVHAIGPQRSLAVGDGKKVCSGVEVEISGAPNVLSAIHSWGLGESTSAGLGWIAR
jgi:CRISPR-associated endoribonuclease Cas6